MKISEKRRQKKIAIMEAALDAWAEEEYNSTSLTLLTEKLGITKPALYRYFRSKDDLFNAITAYCSELTEKQIEVILPKLSLLSPEAKVKTAVSHMGDMIAGHDKYIRFEAYDSARRGGLRWSHSPYPELQRALDLPGPAFRMMMMYIYFFRSSREHSNLMQKRSVREINDLIPRLFFNGIGGSEFRMPEGYTDILEEEEFHDFQQRLSRGSIMGAISGEIREKGFNQVTLEGIATRAGLSKSTLYNYFRNKDEMLTKTSNGFVKEYIDFHALLLSRRKSFEDKLTAHLCLQGIIFPRKPQAVLIMKQLISRDVLSRMERPLQKPDFLVFLEDGIRAGKLKEDLNPAEYQIIFSFFMLTEQIFNSSDTQNNNLLDWLRLLACGYDNKFQQHDKGPSALSKK